MRRETSKFAYSHIRRRGALAGLAGSAGLVLARDARSANEPAGNAPVQGVCFITPQAVEGPFYFDPQLERRDITEGRPGIPLRLILQIVDGLECKPVAKARCDVWHADAEGQYSGYEQSRDAGDGKRAAFLRGTQFSDEAGRVAFETVYPGWYRGRTAHIHFKVFVDAKSVVTGQMYFPDALSEFIYTQIAPYNARQGARDTINATDFILGSSDPGHVSFCAIREEAQTYVASLTIGIDRGASPAKDAPGRPPGPPPGGQGGPPPEGFQPRGRAQKSPEMLVPRKSQ